MDGPQGDGVHVQGEGMTGMTGCLGRNHPRKIPRKRTMGNPRGFLHFMDLFSGKENTSKEIFTTIDRHILRHYGVFCLAKLGLLQRRSLALFCCI